MLWTKCHGMCPTSVRNMVHSIIVELTSHPIASRAHYRLSWTDQTSRARYFCNNPSTKLQFFLAQPTLQWCCVTHPIIAESGSSDGRLRDKKNHLWNELQLSHLPCVAGKCKSCQCQEPEGSVKLVCFLFAKHLQQALWPTKLWFFHIFCCQRLLLDNAKTWAISGQVLYCFLSIPSCCFSITGQFPVTL